MKKKVLSLLFSIAIVLMFFSVTIIGIRAEGQEPAGKSVCKIGDTEYESIDAALKHGETVTTIKDPNTGESNTVSTTIVLIADVVENITIPAERNITLDLNGYVLKPDLSDSQKHSVIINNGNLTIKDSNPTKVHYFQYKTNSEWKYESDTQPSGDVKIAQSFEEISNETTHVKVLGGCITKGNDEKGGALQNQGTLTIKSGNIVGNCSNYGAVANWGKLTMDGGRISGNYSVGLGNFNNSLYNGGAGAIYNQESGILTMNNGELSYNICYYGGGVLNFGNAEVNGGTISNNKIIDNVYNYVNYSCGGGIANDGNGTLVINDVLITKNEATYGGGIAVLFGKVTINGGTISNNIGTWGAGINCQQDELYLLGGTITGNKITNAGNYNDDYCGAGIDLYKSGVLTVGGDVVISGNLSNGVEDNIGIEYYQNEGVEYTIKISETKPLNNGAKIGVRLAKGAGKFIEGADSENYEKYFNSDNPDYGVRVSKVTGEKTTYDYYIDKDIDQSIAFKDVVNSEVTKEYGDKKFIKTVSGAKTTVTYSSSNPSVASINSSTGEVTILKVGTTTIKAIAEETSAYKKAEATYTLTVTKQNEITQPNKVVKTGVEDNKNTVKLISLLSLLGIATVITKKKKK